MVNKAVKLLRNAYIDIRIQRVFLGGRVVSIDNRSEMYDTVSTGYDGAKLIFFKYYHIKPDDVIVDVGCGKGRVFNYLLYRGLKNKMIGYEINKEVADKTAINLSRYKNVSIHSANIFDDFPKQANVFYLFNPFKESMMNEFKSRIWEMKDKSPVILYYNPTCIEVFNDNRFTTELIDVPVLFFGFPYKLAIIRIAEGG